MINGSLFKRIIRIRISKNANLNFCLRKTTASNLLNAFNQQSRDDSAGDFQAQDDMHYIKP